MIQCNIYTKFIQRLTNTLRIWTFQCNCPYISVISMKNLPNIVATKQLINSDQLEIWLSSIYTPNLLSVWQIHFEFEHFIAIVPIAVISMKNYQISLQINFKWIPIDQKFDSVQYIHQFIERLTNTLRIWTFHCNCPYSSNLNEELPNIIANKLQMNSNRSEIWLSAIYTPNLLSVWQIYFEFEHFIAIVPTSVIPWRTTKYHCN